MRARALTDKELAILTDIRRYYSTIFLLWYETGMRYNELLQLQFKDVYNREHINVRASKDGESRLIKISSELKQRLAFMTEKEFYQLSKRTCRGYNMHLKALFPNAQGISTHSFRKTIATNLYLKTKDPYLLKRWLGHKSLGSTGHYIDDLKELDVDKYFGE